MSSIFLENAFWFFAALTLSLVAVIYKLFNSSLKKDLEIHKVVLKAELISYFDAKFLSIKEEVLKEFKSIKDKMNEDQKHLLGNVQNISASIIQSLDMKHDEIEKIGNKYLNKIKINSQ